MTIIEAAKKMNEGYKVRRAKWNKECSIHYGCADPQAFPIILTEVEGIPELDTTDILADDWETTK